MWHGPSPLLRKGCCLTCNCLLLSLMNLGWLVHKPPALGVGNHWPRWNMTLNYASTVRKGEIRKPSGPGVVRWVQLLFFYYMFTWCTRSVKQFSISWSCQLFLICFLLCLLAASQNFPLLIVCVTTVVSSANPSPSSFCCVAGNVSWARFLGNRSAFFRCRNDLGKRNSFTFASV